MQVTPAQTNTTEYLTEGMHTEPMKIEYPVTKTFIQYPALRNPSLEAFFKERVISSCPASRMNSIEEDDDSADAPCTPIGNPDKSRADAIEIEYAVRNTFIDFIPAWGSLRNPSLEGFFQERALQSCPATRVQSLDDTQDKAVVASDVEDLICHDVVEHKAMRSVSLEECLRDIEAKYQNLDMYDDVISTKANTDECTAPATPEILSDSEEAELQARPIAISLTSSLGLWSVGSSQHNLGICKPCVFLWKDANGCQNGTNCTFCHMCPPGVAKQRKKQKQTMRKMVRQFRHSQNHTMAGY